jgi:hypothetical protein
VAQKPWKTRDNIETTYRGVWLGALIGVNVCIHGFYRGWLTDLLGRRLLMPIRDYEAAVELTY